MKVFIVFGVWYQTLLTLSAQDWGYHSNIAQDHWGSIFQQCNGFEQSPIDFRTNRIKFDWSLQPFDLHKLYRTQGLKKVLSNNGHSVQLDLTEKQLEINGGNLPGPFMAEQLHFHWGSNDNKGSEHLCNGRAYPLEMHIVTHSRRYGHVSEAYGVKNALAVLSFWFKVGRHNRFLEPIISQLRNIRRKDSEVELKTVFRLGNLLPSLQRYYRYQGSLTTPPCSEGVIWTKFQTPIYISRYQLNQFRKLGQTWYPEAFELTDNFRKPQPLYGRVVTSNSRRFFWQRCCD